MPRRGRRRPQRLLAAGVVAAALSLNHVATFFIALGAFVYVPVYTLFLKPRTAWNIVLGGSAGSCAALAFYLLFLATNIKLFRAPTKADAWLAFEFSSPYLAVIFLVAMAALLH